MLKEDILFQQIVLLTPAKNNKTTKSTNKYGHNSILQHYNTVFDLL